MTVPVEKMTPEAWVAAWKPRRPKASNDPQKDGLWMQSRRSALTKRQIQLNAPGLANMMTFDLDDKAGRFHVLALVGEEVIPPPAWIVENPVNGHCHVGYLIDDVATSFKARTHPIRYMRAAQRTLGRIMGADSRYAGYATKNPILEPENTTWMVNKVYRLGEIEDWIGDFDKSVSEDHIMDSMDVNESRHQALYAKVAAYAQRNWWKHYSDINSGWKGLQDDVLAYARELNEIDNQGNPLKDSEVYSTAIGETRWAWLHFNEEKLRGIQRARSVRRACVSDRADRVQILKDHAEGGQVFSAAQVAEMFEVSERTAFSYLKEAGIEAQRRKAVSQNVEIVGSLRAAGKSYGEIEQLTGLTREQIRYAAKKAEQAGDTK